MPLEFSSQGTTSVFPHLIEAHVKDRPQVLTIAVEKIELDPDLDDARFRLPR